MKMDSSEIDVLLRNHSSLEYIDLSDKTKVRCSLTKHEMPATVAAIQSYVSGKKYKKARSLKSYDYDKLKPHIIPSTKRNHLNELFCTLTLRHIGKSPEDVERHLKGKKYTRALARWQKCQETGEKFVPRPSRQKKVITSDSDSVSGENQFWEDDSEDDHGSEDDMSDLYPDDDLEKDITQESADNNENSKEETLVDADGPSDCDSDYSMSELDQNNSIENSKSLKSSKDSQNKFCNQTTKQKGKQRKRQQTDLENKN
ncbi:surfeit locus protein 2, partial [Biomphalaria pfeifferi]